MVARNEHTGKAIISKPSTKAYEDGWDRIFGKKEIDCDECEDGKWYDASHGANRTCQKCEGTGKL